MAKKFITPVVIGVATLAIFQFFIEPQLRKQFPNAGS